MPTENKIGMLWSSRNKDVAEIASAAAGARYLAEAIGADGRRMTLAWQIARTVLRLGFVACLALFTGRLIETRIFAEPAVIEAVVFVVLSSLAGMMAELKAACSEATVANGLRAALRDSLVEMSPAQARGRPGGKLIAGLQRHPERLASLVVSHATARSMMGIGPLLATAAIALVSWESALALVLSIPVLIVFFVLLGDVVRSNAQAQEQTFGKLAAQFSDRIRTLPTILANHAFTSEHGKIERRMSAYADSTMNVLRIAFLNAGIIDFFSALAIAVLAVLLGLGHLGLSHVPGFFGLALWQSLFILVVAADFFVPFRRYAEQYHLKAEGEAAAHELDWYFDNASAASCDGDSRSTLGNRVDGLDPANLPTAGLIAISGPSGAGKSTLLRMLAGIEAPASGLAALPQSSSGDDCTWMATDIYVPGGTLGEAIAWNCAGADPATVRMAAERVGLIDEELLPGGLGAHIAEGGTNLSGGQRMRIGIARILLSSGVVFADEPTAKLDPQTAALVRQVLTDAARTRRVIVATHDCRLIQAADRHHVLALQNPSAIAA